MLRRHSLLIVAVGAALTVSAAGSSAQDRPGQSPDATSKAQRRLTLSMLAGGQTTELGPVGFVSGPRDVFTGWPETVDHHPSKSVVARSDKAPTPQPVVLDVPVADEAVTKRLFDAHQCVVAGHADACRFEATVQEVDATGAVSRSFIARGAWVSAFEALASNKKKAAPQMTRLTLAYESLALAGSTPAGPNAVSPNASATTTGVSNGSVLAAAAPVDSAAQPGAKKKHKGFGKFVGGLIKDHGLQAVAMATGVGEAAMVMHSLKLSGMGGMNAMGGMGGAGGWSPVAQSQIATLAQQIATTPGTHQIDAGLPPGARPGAPVDQAAAQVYANAVREQLIAQGANPSRFTVIAGGVAASAASSAVVSAMTKSNTPQPGASVQPSAGSGPRPIAPADSTKTSKRHQATAQDPPAGSNATP